MPGRCGLAALRIGDARRDCPGRALPNRLPSESGRAEAPQIQEISLPCPHGAGSQSEGNETRVLNLAWLITTSV